MTYFPFLLSAAITPIPLACSIISAAALITVITMLVLSIRRKKAVKALLSSGTVNKKTLKKLLYAAFPAKRIITNTVIPSLDEVDPENEEYYSEDRARYYIIDAILITRGGIIAFFPQDTQIGNISNPQTGPWTVSISGKTTPIKNPLVSEKNVIASLNAVIRKYHISNIPLHDVIVFPGMSDNIKFKYHEDNIHTLDTLIPHLRDINKERFMSGSEIRQVVNCLTICKNRGIAFIKKEKEAARRQLSAGYQPRS